jgi:hypothetical protein
MKIKEKENATKAKALVFVYRKYLLNFFECVLPYGRQPLFRGF